MKVYIDRQKINARSQLANGASIGGLLLLLASVLVPLFVQGLARFSWIMMVLGLGIAMLGIYYANRWVRKPRPEESLDKALKAFDDHYHLYHYPASLPCDHILLTPNGLIAMDVVNLNGSFFYRQGRWKEAMTIGRALRYIVEERVEDPVTFSAAMSQELGRRIEDELKGKAAVPIKTLTVFSHPGAELEIEGASIPACKIEKLRKLATVGSEKLAPGQYDELSSYLENLTVGR